MFKIASNGIITVNRGDSFNFPIKLNIASSINTSDYVLSSSDVIYLGIMEPNQPFETAVIRKKFTSKELDEDNNINIRFWPKDTQFLIPGKYYYQVKLQTVDSETGNIDVETIVDKTLFYIQE